MATKKKAKTSKKRKPKASAKFTCPHCGKPIDDSEIASHMAGKSGRKQAQEKGSEYYANLQAQRRTRGGGRPPLKKKAPKTNK